MREAGEVRCRLPFRTINRAADPGYQPGMQRHHLLPRQLLSARCFGSLFDRLGRDRVGFDDFRRNGLLLPCTDRAAIGVGLPLHRGPHGHYNGMVFERVGQIEGTWAQRRRHSPTDALEEALMRLALLQRALRRRLLAERRRLRLNRADPLGSGRDFAELDAMAELLWRETEQS
uniref:AHH domain-containing protein n=1 Tax=Altererythrobacter segetis TaxID=1104773 RepID=UPI00140A5811|nr:AHH domain-containing protein [Altererythrobacter segetis]